MKACKRHLIHLNSYEPKFCASCPPILVMCAWE